VLASAYRCRRRGIIHSEGPNQLIPVAGRSQTHDSCFSIIVVTFFSALLSRIVTFSLFFLELLHAGYPFFSFSESYLWKHKCISSDSRYLSLIYSNCSMISRDSVELMIMLITDCHLLYILTLNMRKLVTFLLLLLAGECSLGICKLVCHSEYVFSFQI
jgi:hypothetical protein